MLDLASNSRRTIVLLLLSTACTSTQTSATVDAAASQNSKKRNSAEFRIAPPPGANDQQRQNREKIEQVLAGEAGTDGVSEVKLPASVMGLQPGDVTGDPIALSREQARMQRTDAEIASNAGLGEFEKRLGEVDRVLDVSEEANRPMTPSYTAQTQKIREMFRNNRFEDALVEVNDLLLHYPRSGVLWMMKGTLHLRLSQSELSLAAYEKAFDIEPSQRLLAQIEDLRRVIGERETLRRQRINSLSQTQVPQPVQTLTPVPIGTPEPKPVATPTATPSPKVPPLELPKRGQE